MIVISDVIFMDKAEHLRAEGTEALSTESRKISGIKVYAPQYYNEKNDQFVLLNQFIRKQVVIIIKFPFHEHVISVFIINGDFPT